MHETGTHGTAGISDAQDAGQLPRVVVAVPDVDPPRRQVLGDARIDNIKITPFNEDFQNFITRYVWGENWTRTGLVPGTRSVLVMGLMIAMGRWDEYRLHVKAAFNNGLDVDFIKEVILVSAIYCGVPAANSAMHHAEEVLKEMGKI